MKPISPQIFEGVWSATPTPFQDNWRIDQASVKRLVEHHLRLGVKGLFLAGSCGEGAWMPDKDRSVLVQTAVAAAQGRIPIAVQVSDNSAARILENIARAKSDGAQMVVIAPPHFVMNATPANIQSLYLDAIRGSSLPVVLYDLGAHRVFSPTLQTMKTLLAEPNVVAIKDSSGDSKRMRAALTIRRKRPDLRLLSGGEFNCVEYLQAGYDGLMLGGAAFNGFLAGQIMAAVASGEIERANALQERMNAIMYAAYGGKKIKCWLSGEKKLLMELGVFKTWHNHLKYPLTPACIKAIERIAKTERAVLLPTGSTPGGA